MTQQEFNENITNARKAINELHRLFREMGDFCTERDWNTRYATGTKIKECGDVEDIKLLLHDLTQNKANAVTIEELYRTMAEAWRQIDNLSRY